MLAERPFKKGVYLVLQYNKLYIESKYFNGHNAGDIRADGVPAVRSFK